jgi:tetratricopeptide (TPR) repeat protein
MAEANEERFGRLISRGAIAMEGVVTGIPGLFGELKRRRVFRALLAYGAGAFAVLQGAGILFAVLMLPDMAFSLLALGCVAGFPIVAFLSWAYDLTAEGMLRSEDVPEEMRGTRVPMRRWLELIGAFTVAATIILVTAAAVGRQQFPSSDDGRVGLAVFPFRTTGTLGTEWSEGTADLLATALEGTPALRIVDPWPLWRPLRAEPTASPIPPDVADAEELTREAGAHRFLLGSIVPAGGRVEGTLRLYQIGRAEPLRVITVSAAEDELAELVREAAVRVLAQVWGPRRPANLPSELDFDATQSPEALKAYLSAKEAMRRGWVDSANVAIDQALVLDSTFVLAMVEAVGIKSWGQAIQGQPYRGFFELLARAEPYEEGLNERTRLRLTGTRASVRTDGAEAITAARRILELDPLDYNANATLEFYQRIYGWQLGPPTFDGVELAERVLQLDSTQVPALAVRALYAVANGDSEDPRVQLERLRSTDTTGALARGEIRGLRAVLATSGEFDLMLPEITSAPITEVRGVAGHLRVARVPLYGRLIEALEESPDPTIRGAMGTERLRWNMARGWPERVQDDIDSGVYDTNGFFRTAQRYLVAADLVGMGDSALAAATVDDLIAYVPADSALHYFQTKPVWWTGWLIGAWHAQMGDTAVAREWVEAIGTLPEGGTSEDYIGSLQSDIEARLDAREGRTAAALDHAKRAFRLWTIHTENTTEALPEPLMRQHMAALYRANAEPDSARAVLSSMVPPTAWFGFLTARSAFELGELEEARGELSLALHHYDRARELWLGGGRRWRDGWSGWTLESRELVRARGTGSSRAARSYHLGPLIRHHPVQYSEEVVHQNDSWRFRSVIAGSSLRRQCEQEPLVVRCHAVDRPGPRTALEPDPPQPEELSRCPGGEYLVALHFRDHEWAWPRQLHLLEEDLTSTVRPTRIAAAVNRNLPSARIHVWERLNVDFSSATFVGGVRDPLTVWRDGRPLFTERANQKRARHAVGPGTKHDDVDAARGGHQ